MNAAAIHTITPRTAFANVSCSMCGQSFGPGYSGFSSCSDHREPDASIEFYSNDLGGQIRCTYEADEEVTNYQVAVVTGSLDLLSVFVGGIDMTQHLTNSALKIIGFELGAALQKQAERAAENEAQDAWERRQEKAMEYAA